MTFLVHSPSKSAVFKLRFLTERKRRYLLKIYLFSFFSLKFILVSCYPVLLYTEECSYLYNCIEYSAYPRKRQRVNEF